MAKLLLPIITAALIWRLAAPGERFLPNFAKLLTDSKAERGLLTLLSGRSYLTGKFQDRNVAVRLQLKRSRYGRGNLVVAMQTGGPPTLDYAGIDANARDEAGRQALDTIAAEELSLTVDGGWLKVGWEPHGLMIFPGRFSQDRWATVLGTMHVLATSLENASKAQP